MKRPVPPRSRRVIRHQKRSSGPVLDDQPDLLISEDRSPARRAHDDAHAVERLSCLVEDTATDGSSFGQHDVTPGRRALVDEDRGVERRQVSRMSSEDAILPGSQLGEPEGAIFAGRGFREFCAPLSVLGMELAESAGSIPSLTTGIPGCLALLEENRPPRDGIERHQASALDGLAARVADGSDDRGAGSGLDGFDCRYLFLFSPGDALVHLGGALFRPAHVLRACRLDRWLARVAREPFAKQVPASEQQADADPHEHDGLLPSHPDSSRDCLLDQRDARRTRRSAHARPGQGPGCRAEGDEREASAAAAPLASGRDHLPDRILELPPEPLAQELSSSLHALEHGGSREVERLRHSSN